MTGDGIGAEVIARPVRYEESAIVPPLVEGESRLSHEEEQAFRSTRGILTAVAGRCSDIAVGKILGVSQVAEDGASPRGNRTKGRRDGGLDDRPVAIVRAERMAELNRTGRDMRGASEGGPGRIQIER